MAFHRILFVVEAVIAGDLRLAIVSGPDQLQPVKKPVRLIEVHCGRYVFRNHIMPLPRLGNAVDLYGEQDWNVDAIQFARQDDHGRSSPTLAEQDDPRPGLFFGAEHSIAICVEQMQDIPVSRLSVAVFVDLDVRALRSELMNLLSDDNGSVVRVGVAYESPYETYDHIGNVLRHILDWRRRRTQRGNPEQENQRKTGIRSGEAKHEELPQHSDDGGGQRDAA